MESNEIIVGSEFNYIIDKSHGLSSDGFIAAGTESIVYKGVKISADGKMRLSCVLKFKYKAIKVGAGENSYKTLDVYNKFITHDLKLFDELQDCRSVVRIFDVIEDLGSFSVTDTHVPEGKKSISINRERFFCVVEEFIDGWSLEEYCRDEYWKLTEEVDIGNGLKKKCSFHDFNEERRKKILKCYQHDYDIMINYQSEMFRFMLNLCEIMEYITDNKGILHLDIKPDNIMVTRYGRELVLIDFGRSERIDAESKAVQSPLGGADYNDKEHIARMFQYGTLGYAAPECYAEPINGSAFPFDGEGLVRGKMTVESDIFSFGATFWECLNIFELYTGSNEFAKNKNEGGSYDFYRKYMLNDDAYFDRDLSLTSSHYHEKLEQIIKKCTRKRIPGYLDSPLYYHSYKTLKKDIITARDSAPAIVKTENIKVRNSFGVVGVMAGLITVLFFICILLKFTGSYFAQSKIESIMDNYNPTKIEQLQSAALEQMNSATQRERCDIYQKVYNFLTEDNSLEFREAQILTDLLKEIDDTDFTDNSVDTILLNIDRKGFGNTITYIVTNLHNCEGTGYMLSVQIYNAMNRIDLNECYKCFMENTDSIEYNTLVKRLAEELNHDEIISQIADSIIKEDKTIDPSDTSEYNNTLAEIKYEISTELENVVKDGEEK